MRLSALIRKAKIATMVVGLGFIAVVAVAFAMRPDTPKCDTGEAQRRAWIDTASAGHSPRQRGFRVSGRCSDAIGDRMLSCSIESARSVHGDSSYLRRARNLGFVTYVCEAADGRVEFPITDVLAAP